MHFLAEYPADEYPEEDLRCQTEDVEFESVRMKCRPGSVLERLPVIRTSGVWLLPSSSLALSPPLRLPQADSC